MSERIVNVNKEADYKGIHFRSSLELQTARTLDEMGIPYSYEERKLELLEGFRSPFQKDKVRSITYTPDFEIGNIMLECKGFETPEWKLKRKLLFKYLKENEPYISFYQIHDARKSLLSILDNHWASLGYYIEVTPQPKKSKKLRSLDSGSIIKPQKFDSITQAMDELHLTGKATGPILNSITGKKEYVYGYSWSLRKIIL